MDRNDQILAAAFGTLVVAITLRLYASSATAAAWVQAIGVFAAVLLTGEITRRQVEVQAKQRRNEEERVVAMRVAARFRPWLRIAADAVIRVQQFDETDGIDGEDNLAIPPFDIDSDLAALLSVEHAKKVYSLLERGARLEDVVSGTANYVDQDAARQEYYKGMADLFDDVRALYRTLARNTGLHELTCQPWELKAIAKARNSGSTPPVPDSADF